MLPVQSAGCEAFDTLEREWLKFCKPVDGGASLVSSVSYMKKKKIDAGFRPHEPIELAEH